MMTTRYQKVLEINGKEKISLAIVKFPPFKLRAAMVEKDPVIWLHLLEVYVQHMSYLLHGDNLDFLSDETVDHLCIFVRAYLHEMSEEEGKLLSLGINADVLKQLQLLRAYVLQLIKSCGLLYLKLNTESLWDITRSYVEGNASTVRLLIEGSLRPTINTQKAQLDRTYQIQQHIRYLIEANRFGRVDLKSLELLLAADDKGKSSFTDNFVSAKWVDTLESMYGKEPGSYLSDWGKKLGILSFLSCSVTHLSTLLKQMSITNLRTLSMYPLLGSLLIDARFQEKLPHIKTKIPFLSIREVPKTAPHLSGPIVPNVNVEQIATIKELFPDLTSNQITKLLQRYDNNTEVIINNLFENPSVISSLEDGPLQDDKVQNTTEKLVEEHKPKENSLPVITPKDKIEKKNMSFPTNDVPDAVRNKTLSRALSLLYDATEDERDDTYDDAEVKQASADRVSVDTSDTAKESIASPTVSKYDKIEGYLWEFLKRDKNLFTRQQRGSKQRKEMKKETNWSDEQIEGWSRMIEKSPKRAQLLEEKYIFKGNIRQGKKTFTKAQESKEDFDRHVANSTVNSPNTNNNNDSGREKTSNKQEPLTKEQQKRKNARNEKLKSSRANHNRKAGRDKKLAKSGAL